jgi:hypothetical protein
MRNSSGAAQLYPQTYQQPVGNPSKKIEKSPFPFQFIKIIPRPQATTARYLHIFTSACFPCFAVSLFP